MEDKVIPESEKHIVYLAKYEKQLYLKQLAGYHICSINVSHPSHFCCGLLKPLIFHKVLLTTLVGKGTMNLDILTYLLGASNGCLGQSK